MQALPKLRPAASESKWSPTFHPYLSLILSYLSSSALKLEAQTQKHTSAQKKKEEELASLVIRYDKLDVSLGTLRTKFRLAMLLHLLQTPIFHLLPNPTHRELILDDFENISCHVFIEPLMKTCQLFFTVYRTVSQRVQDKTRRSSEALERGRSTANLSTTGPPVCPSVCLFVDRSINRALNMAMRAFPTSIGRSHPCCIPTHPIPTDCRLSLVLAPRDLTGCAH